MENRCKNMIDVSKIKLVIWDLDDTFWNGTLAEGTAKVNEENVRTAGILVDKGIMNSICSKNDFEKTKEFLTQHNLQELFVFPSIDWSPKATRIKGIIEAMNLRPANVLFIDDNEINLNEAKYFLPELMTLNASELAEFKENLLKLTKSDLQHKRLKQYRILETKTNDMREVGNNEEFLSQSDINVCISNDCDHEIDRIAEMVERTNQLNYTKVRSSRKELEEILSNKDFECGIVNASDKYGDYGIVGFYALDKKTGKLLHFLFSCRTLGMRVEQWVYESLNFPELQIEGEVAAELEKKYVVTWINRAGNKHKDESRSSSNTNLDDNFSVLLKGPCDLSGVINYLGEDLSKHVTAEFNYVNQEGVSVTAFNTSTHILASEKIKGEDLNKLLESAPFLESGAWNSDIFAKPWNIIFQSILPDSHEGQYRHKKTGIKITFSSANYNLCDPESWDHFIDGSYTNHGFKFTKGVLKRFSEEYEYVGYTPASEIVSNWKEIVNKLSKDTTIVFMLGVTIDKEGARTDEFKDHAKNHEFINKQMKEAFIDNPSVRFLEYDDFVRQQSDFADCINHFQRSVYHKIAVAMVDEINRISANMHFKSKSKLKLFGERIINKIKNKINS